MHIILTKLKNIDTHEYSLDQVVIPAMYFQHQSEEFDNTQNYLSHEFKRQTSSVAEASSETTQQASPSRPGPAPKVLTKRTANVTQQVPTKRVKI
jgi:hypothetical protein